MIRAALPPPVRRVVRLAAVTLAVAAAGVVVPSPAPAATCSSASGVSVVVDFHQLGKGLSTYCDSGGAGEYADQQFADAGHTLTYVQNEAFVCRVDGAPASDPCTHTPPSDAYWSLWWSDGKSGTWSYSSTGVASLKVPAGGYVALSWQQGDAKAKPGAPATAHGSEPSSSPTTKPPSTPQPSTGPSHGPSSSAPVSPSGSPTAASSTSPSASHKTHHGTRHRASKHPTPHPASTDRTKGSHALGPVGAVSDGTGGSGGSGGLPGWVAPLAVAALFDGVATITLLRRKGDGGP